MCFGGLERLSGMTRSAGGVPASSRARRRASFAAANFLARCLRAFKVKSQALGYRYAGPIINLRFGETTWRSNGRATVREASQ